jgi:hypothetical protein
LDGSFWDEVHDQALSRTQQDSKGKLKGAGGGTASSQLRQWLGCVFGGFDWGKGATPLVLRLRSELPSMSSPVPEVANASDVLPCRCNANLPVLKNAIPGQIIPFDREERSFSPGLELLIVKTVTPGLNDAS